jgi:protein SCO1/2
MSKRNSTKFQKFSLLAGFVLFPAILISIFGTMNHHYMVLPYFGPKIPYDTVVNGEKVTDTIYHTIPYFSFTDQDGNEFNRDHVEGKIYIVDFFFTHCPTICPRMSQQLRRVQQQFDMKEMDDIMILSHTIDPENDDVATLKAYAEKLEAGDRWKFLTGDMDYIYDIARNGYFLNATEDENAAGGFLHSKMFMVIDKQKHIRGIYDGTETEDVNRMVEEIKMLLKEESVEKAEAENE